MLAPERHNLIEAILRDKETVSVAELSQVLKVSPVTVRHDLNQMADQGRLVRTHGGAMRIAPQPQREFSFATRQKLHAERKKRIGVLAASLIQPVESILLDSSTTALAVGQAIKQDPRIGDLTVVTTGLRTALEMAEAPGVTTIVTGGTVREITGSVTGSLVVDVLEKVNIHKAFLGTWGITLAEGLTETHLQEAELKQTIIARCRQVIVVADSSKLGRIALATFASLDQIDTVVTDDGAPEELVQEMRQRGIQVLLA